MAIHRHMESAGNLSPRFSPRAEQGHSEGRRYIGRRKHDVAGLRSQLPIEVDAERIHARRGARRRGGRFSWNSAVDRRG
jgi:hypothetical protein